MRVFVLLFAERLYRNAFSSRTNTAEFVAVGLCGAAFEGQIV